jgi:hypothetical protein
MIKTRASLYGIEESIDRNVVITTTNDIRSGLGISPDVYTVYDVRDKLKKAKDKRGTIIGNNTTNESFLNITYKEAPEDNVDVSLLPYRPDTQPIYIDKSIYAFFTPILLSRKMTVTFEYHNKSKSTIIALLNKLRLRTANDTMYRRHDLEYYYTIPNFVTGLLAHINTLKNKRLDVPLELDEYIANTFDNRADFINNPSGSTYQGDFVIRERQLQVMSYITTELPSIEQEFDDETNTWFFSFDFEFIYQKPVSLYLEYPLLVFNSLIDKSFRTFDNPSLPKDAFITYGSDGLLGLFGLRKTVKNMTGFNHYLVIPSFDTPDLEPSSKYLARMFSVLVCIDINNPNHLFNIKEIPGIKFKENVLNFILTSEREFIGDMRQSMFLIELYKDFKKDYNNKVLLDIDGNLTSLHPLDIKNTYRVVFSVFLDLTLLDPAAIKRIKAFINNEVVSECVHETIADCYLNLLNISDSELAKLVTNITKVGDVPFLIQNRNSTSFMTKETALTLVSVLEEK